MNKLFLIVLLFVSACAASVKIAPTPEALPSMEEKVPGITLERANKGFVLYKAKCAHCHRLHQPAEYTISKWENILNKMYPKARVKDEDQKKLITDYINSLSK